MSSVPRIRRAQNVRQLRCGPAIGTLVPSQLRLALSSPLSIAAVGNPSLAAPTSISVPHFGWRTKKLGHETGQWQTAAKCSTRSTLQEPTATGRVVSANSDGCDPTPKCFRSRAGRRSTPVRMNRARARSRRHRARPPGSAPRRMTALRTGSRPSWPVPADMSASRMTATRFTLGAISLSSSSHFPAIPNSYMVNPVALPPGRARLATKPAPTGSEPGQRTALRRPTVLVGSQHALKE
jgi:hypothetical protein